MPPGPHWGTAPGPLWGPTWPLHPWHEEQVTKIPDILGFLPSMKKFSKNSAAPCWGPRWPPDPSPVEVSPTPSASYFLFISIYLKRFSPPFTQHKPDGCIKLSFVTYAKLISLPGIVVLIGNSFLWCMDLTQFSSHFCFFTDFRNLLKLFRTQVSYENNTLDKNTHPGHCKVSKVVD